MDDTLAWSIWVFDRDWLYQKGMLPKIYGNFGFRVLRRLRLGRFLSVEDGVLLFCVSGMYPPPVTRCGSR